MQNSEKIIEKEQKQLGKLKKQLNKPRFKGYIIVLYALIMLVHLLDSFATDVGTKVQSFAVNEYFVLGQGLSVEAGLQQMTLISIAGLLFSFISPFYKTLMDRIGRRPIFIINTLGMVGGLLMCWFASSFPIYFAGCLVTGFFVMHDTQMVYIYEIAPAKYRSIVYFTCKFVGVLGTLAIPLLRGLYIGSDGSGWHNVFLIPAIAGLVVFLLSVLFLRESDVFVKDRVRYLEKPFEERMAEKKDKKAASGQKAGIGPAFKYMRRNPQLKWLMVSSFLVTTSIYGLTMYFETFMSTVISTENVTSALYLQPFAMAVVYLLGGFVSDGLGRKLGSLIFTVLSLGGFISFIICTINGASPILIGILLGVAIGSYWNVNDLSGMMYAESAPTAIRGSVLGVQGIIMLMGTMVSMILCMVLLSVLPLSTIMIGVGSVGFVLGIAILLIKTKETMGTDLSRVGHEQEEGSEQ